MKTHGIVALALCGWWCGLPLGGQAGSKFPRPPSSGYPSPASFDAEIADPDALHAIHNKSALPLHYYQIEFKRIDGDDFASHWRA